MPFLKRVDYTKSFVTLFILVGVSFAFLILFSIYSIFLNFQNELDKKNASYEIELKQSIINDFYKHYKDFLVTVEHNRFFKSYLIYGTEETKKDLVTLFETLTEHEKYITQLRYLDINGNEIVRVDRNKPNEEIHLVEDEKLQNKKHRDYFSETIKLKKGEVFLSKLDLNIEHKKIEIPHKPVYRFAMPVFCHDEPKGIIIVNLFGKYLLENLTYSPSFYLDIFDQDGEVLVSNDSKQNLWSRYLKSDSLLDRKQFVENEILFDGNNGEKLYIALRSKNWLNNFTDILNYKILLLLVFVILIAFILAKYLANIPKKLFDELELQQVMLLRQSKVAAMGEMTSMLAHQWRQPLNAISVLLQEIRIRKIRNKLSDEDFTDISNQIIETVNHMSSTIDNFRDFFKPNKTKNIFNISTAILNVKSILDVKLKKDYIDFKILKDENFDDELLNIDSYEGEFKQVVINLINNSIEAFEENKIEDKQISVKIENKNEKILISVIDNAGGISEEIKDKIFEPYSSTKLEKNGTGLGLYMSKMLVSHMNGSLDVKSDNIGTIFTITLSASEN